MVYTTMQALKDSLRSQVPTSVTVIPGKPKCNHPLKPTPVQDVLDNINNYELPDSEFLKYFQSKTLHTLCSHWVPTPVQLEVMRMAALAHAKAKDQKLHHYFLTFTLKSADLDGPALEWIIGRQNCDYFHSMEFVEELTKEGVKHWHAILTSTKSLEKSRFKYYERYGFVDFKRITPNTQQNVHDYINKVGNSITLNKPQTIEKLNTLLLN